MLNHVKSLVISFHIDGAWVVSSGWLHPPSLLGFTKWAPASDVCWFINPWMSCILFFLLSIAIGHHRPKREIGEKLVHQLSCQQSAKVSYQSHEFPPCSLVKAPCSDAFSMACPSFPNKIPAPFFLYGFPMVFLWSSYGFPMVFRFSYGFPMVFRFSYGFPMVFRFSYGFPMGFLRFSHGFPVQKKAAAEPHRHPPRGGLLGPLERFAGQAPRSALCR